MSILGRGIVINDEAWSGLKIVVAFMPVVINQSLKKYLTLGNLSSKETHGPQQLGMNPMNRYSD